MKLPLNWISTLAEIRIKKQWESVKHRQVSERDTRWRPLNPNPPNTHGLKQPY